jgi:hypothetical protein
MKMILASLLFVPLLAQAVEETAVRKAPPVDFWGIALFLGVVVIAVSWLVWNLRRSAKKAGKQGTPQAR